MAHRKSWRTQEFKSLLAGLPSEVQVQALKQYKAWRKGDGAGSLQFKCVDSKKQAYSVRVGISYRAVCFIDGNAVIWVWIGSHADYDQVIRNL